MIEPNWAAYNCFAINLFYGHHFCSFAEPSSEWEHLGVLKVRPAPGAIAQGPNVPGIRGAAPPVGNRLVRGHCIYCFILR
jgi:hypothetical protein